MHFIILSTIICVTIIYWNTFSIKIKIIIEKKSRNSVVVFILFLFRYSLCWVGIESCVTCNVTLDITISFLPLSLSLIPLLFVQEFGKHMLQCGMGWDQLLLAYVGVRNYDLSPLHNMKNIWVFKLVQNIHTNFKDVYWKIIKKIIIIEKLLMGVYNLLFTFSNNTFPCLLHLML